MIGRLDSVSKVSPSEQAIRPEILAFKAEIAKANGTLIQLRKTTKEGENLYVAARYMKKPGMPTAGEDESNYFWDRIADTDDFDGVVAIDVFAGRQPSGIVPVGRKDWLIEKDQAIGGSNVRTAFISTNEHESLAQEKWTQEYGSFPFKVDPEYQGQDIGTFMLATSSIVLPSIGVKVFRVGKLIEGRGGEKTYNRLGLKTEDFIIDGKFTALPIERLSKSTKVDEVISEFV